MNVSIIVLFLHLTGVAGVFAGFGTWLFGVMALRRAQRVEQMRTLASRIALSDPVTVASILLLGAASVYRGVTASGTTAAWIDVATVGFLLIAPIGPLVIAPRMKRSSDSAAAAPGGPKPAALAKQVCDPMVGTALQRDVALLLGIVFLMTNKPPLAESVMVLALAIALGLMSGLILRWASRKAGIRGHRNPTQPAWPVMRAATVRYR